MKKAKVVLPAWTPFEEVKDRPVPLPKGCVGVLRNSRWFVFAYQPVDSWMGPTQLIMIRSALAPWKLAAGHSWADFQRIKNELYGPEAQAVEYYPRETDLIDTANMYWLWVLLEPKPDVYRQQFPGNDPGPWNLLDSKRRPVVNELALDDRDLHLETPPEKSR